MDVDTRLLRYFAAVAREGNLTRAAERLFVSQPALTKQIRQLENQLGVRLFSRSRAGMTLTAAGQALAGQVPAVLDGWDQALRETRAAARRAGRVLRAGFLAGAANEATEQIIAAFCRRRPGWRVEMRAATWLDPTAGLASGDADVALLRLPFPGQDSLRVKVLFSEPRWVALPAAHPLAARERIAFAELWDEPFVAAPAETGWWRDWWLAADERAGHPVRIGAVTETGQPDDWLSAIANGYGVALAPESGARYYARPGVVYRPVTGVSPSQVGVAWRPAADANAVIGDFVRCCLDSKPPGPAGGLRPPARPARPTPPVPGDPSSLTSSDGPVFTGEDPGLWVSLVVYSALNTPASPDTPRYSRGGRVTTRSAAGEAQDGQEPEHREDGRGPDQRQPHVAAGAVLEQRPPPGPRGQGAHRADHRGQRLDLAELPHPARHAVDRHVGAGEEDQRVIIRPIDWAARAVAGLGSAQVSLPALIDGAVGVVIAAEGRPISLVAFTITGARIVAGGRAMPSGRAHVRWCNLC